MQRKIIVSTFLSVAVIFLLTASLFAFPSFGNSGSNPAFSENNNGSKIIVTNHVGGYMASNGVGSVYYVGGSFSLDPCTFRCSINITMLIGVDVNFRNPGTSGIQVGVLLSRFHAYAFFVYNNTKYLFNRTLSCCDTFYMTIVFPGAGVNTPRLILFDATTGVSFHRNIPAGGYKQESAEWLIDCPDIYCPTFAGIYSGAILGFTNTDAAQMGTGNLSGLLLPLKQLPNLTTIIGIAGGFEPIVPQPPIGPLPHFLSSRSFIVEGAS